MPKTPPPRTEDQQRRAERLTALRTGTVEAVRAWAEKYGVELFGDDELVLRSIHEARAADVGMSAKIRRESKHWLERFHA
jgi:hypothetical protein